MGGRWDGRGGGKRKWQRRLRPLKKEVWRRETGDRPRSGSSVLPSPRALRRLSEAGNGSTVTAGRNRGDLLVQARVRGLTYSIGPHCCPDL